MTKFGVPYPKETKYFTHNRVMRQCPICLQQIWDHCDNEGEIETNHYGEHCEQQHPDA